MQYEHLEKTLKSESLAASWQVCLDNWAEYQKVEIGDDALRYPYWQECLAGWEKRTATKLAEAQSHIHDERSQFITAARDVEDPEELDAIVAFTYIQLKSRWMIINTHINYQIALTGEPDPELSLRGSLVSVLLGEIEPLLAGEDLQRIATFLAKPIGEIVKTKRTVRSLEMAA